MNTVKLKDIRIDGGTQPRVAIDESVVAEYADIYRHSTTTLPPVDVFYDGITFWLADGFHRFLAMQRIGASSIQIKMHRGTQRDAVLFSAGANQTHGLKRTNADKRKAVTTLLSDAEWSKWTDSEIARRCGVTHPFVGDVRRSLETVTSDPLAVPRKYQTRHGTEAVMNVARIGRSVVRPDSAVIELYKQKMAVGKWEPSDVDVDVSGSTDGVHRPANWSDPLVSSSRRIADISDREAESAVALREMKRLWRTLSSEDRQAFREYIDANQRRNH